jgi:hypothetical protein
VAVLVLLNGREITLGISESCIENQNTINYFLLIVKCRCRCNGKIPHLMEVLYIKNRREKYSFYISPKQKEQINFQKWLNVESTMNG